MFDIKNFKNKKMKLAIVGRPNVGKSALFNRICKKRLSIVDAKEGVTKDRLYGKSELFGKPFEIIDTGGIDESLKNENIKEQAFIALNQADVVLMVVDGRVGPLNLDRKISKILFKLKKPVILVVNKIDDTSFEELICEFYSLGFERVIGVSALHGIGIENLLEKAFKIFSSKGEELKEDLKVFTKIAIVGKSNVGKSTLLNFLLNEKRSVVSDIPGTTTDSIDANLSYDNRIYRFVDTYGIKRKNREMEAVEKFAFIRTKEAIKRSEICVFIVDAKEGITLRDKKIFKMIEKSKKGFFIFLNKWDLIKGYKKEEILKVLKEEIKNNNPIFIGSLKEGIDLKEFFGILDDVKKSFEKRIKTPLLNKFMESTVQKYHPPMILGKRLRIYYLTQIKISPPTFLLFVNKKSLLLNTYKKYLLNQIKSFFGFSGVPVILNVKSREENFLKSKNF
jgi:GTP-binding protein